MKTRRYSWKHFFAGWKQALVIAIPMFVLAMWFGIGRGYSDLGLFAVAMALGTFHVAELVVNLFEKIREHRRKSEEALMPNSSNRSSGRGPFPGR